MVPDAGAAPKLLRARCGPYASEPVDDAHHPIHHSQQGEGLRRQTPASTLISPYLPTFPAYILTCTAELRPGSELGVCHAPIVCTAGVHLPQHQLWKMRARPTAALHAALPATSLETKGIAAVRDGRRPDLGKTAPLLSEADGPGCKADPHPT